MKKGACAVYVFQPEIGADKAGDLQFADGRTGKASVYQLHSQTIGTRTMNDIPCSVGKTSVLFGMLSRFNSFAIDAQHSILSLA
jgi:hypothetical protein